MGIILHFFPNGEFTQGVTSLGKSKRAKPVQKFIPTQISKQRRDAYLQYREHIADMYKDPSCWVVGSRFLTQWDAEIEIVSIDTKGFTWRTYRKDGVPIDVESKIDLRRMAFEGRWLPLGLSDARILTKPPSRKKCESMTKYMARNIRNGCYLLEHKYGKDTLSFLTVTLPSLSKDSLEICSLRWDTIVHEFLKRLRYHVEQKGSIPFEYVYCTEIQLKRLQHRGEYAPHLHVVFRGREGRKSPWVLTPKMVRKAWVQVLKCHVTEDFSTTALENIQRIRKSAARYMAKYLSKGGNTNAQIDTSSDTPALHTQWGGMSRSISRCIKAAITRVVSSNDSPLPAYDFIRRVPEFIKKGYIKFYKRGFIPLRGNDDKGNNGIHVGYGVLSVPLLEGGLTMIMWELMPSDLPF